MQGTHHDEFSFFDVCFASPLSGKLDWIISKALFNLSIPWVYAAGGIVGYEMGSSDKEWRGQATQTQTQCHHWCAWENPTHKVTAIPVVSGSASGAVRACLGFSQLSIKCFANRTSGHIPTTIHHPPSDQTVAPKALPERDSVAATICVLVSQL